jgi:hypothetical protein
MRRERKKEHKHTNKPEELERGAGDSQRQLTNEKT